MTIHELRYKINELGEQLKSREVYAVILIVAVGFASFGLGRLGRQIEERKPVVIESATALPASALLYRNKVDAEDAGAFQTGGKIVASKSGAKYHFPWCSGAKRISEANKVWFNSIEEARKAGYAPASNCKGLE